MKIITTAAIKGGTGKTTTAAALAQAAVKDGKKVLAVDLDSQANFSCILNAKVTGPGVYQLLHGTPAAELIQETPQGIYVISASPDLAVEKTKAGSARRLAAALEPVKEDFDLIIIDTPPQMGELPFNALQAAEGLIIPLESDINSLHGLYQVVDIALQLQQSNPALRILGAVLCRFDARSNINRYMQEQIAEAVAKAGAPLLMTIRSGIAIREAQALQRSIFEYAPRSKPAQDYLKLYQIVMEA